MDHHEQLVHLPGKPTRARLLDSLPLTPTFHVDGTVTSDKTGIIGPLLLPVLGTLAVSALWILL